MTAWLDTVIPQGDILATFIVIIPLSVVGQIK